MRNVLFLLLILIICTPSLAQEVATQPQAEISNVPLWVWPAALFGVSLLLGIVAVIGGVGGGVLFVPVVSAFFPFHMDFVRCTGLIVALSGSISAGPGLLRRGLANLRLAIPLALIASCSSIVGAMIGLKLPGNFIQIALGVTIFGIVIIMLLSKKSDYPKVAAPDKLSGALRIYGIYHEASLNQDISWKIHRTPLGMTLFIFIGILAGMFGLGAGWANVPVLNLLMGAPLKISVATSNFLLSITDTTAAWVYINKGAALPIILVPSIVGMMLGARIGVKILSRIKPHGVRIFVLVLLVCSAISSLLKGFGLL